MKLSLAKINFLNILITAFLFTISVAILEVYTSYKNFDKQVERMQKRYIFDKKMRSEEQVKKIIDQIKNNISSRYVTLTQTLSEKIDDVTFVYNNIKNSNPSISQKELLEEFYRQLDSYKTPYNSEYFYIFDKEMNLTYHGDQKELVGKNLYDFKNSTDLHIVVEKALKYGESSGKYFWINPKNGKKENKFVYVKKIPNSDSYIATGFYIDAIEEEIKNSIKKLVLTSRFGLDKKGYFWIHSLSGKMICHPMQPKLDGKSVLNYKNQDSRYPFREMNNIVAEKNFGYVDYLWKYPNSYTKEEKKISYVQKLGYSDWVIGSGFYFRAQISAVEEEKRSLHNDLTDSLTQIFIALGIIFAGAIVIAYYVFKRINKIEDDKKNHFNMLKQYKIVLDESSIVSKTNRDGFITYVNKKFEEVCGYSSSELIGKSHNLLRHQSMPKELFNEMWLKISAGLVWSGIIKNRNKDGVSYYINTTVVPVKDKNGDIIEYISASSDITKLITTNNMLENFTLTDGLTGLGSRVKLMNDLENIDEKILAIVDIIKFTEVNDMYGQHVGDKIIKEVADEIFEFAKNSDMKTYRLHADVFAILCDKQNDNEFILKINNLVKYLKEYHFDKEEVSATFDFIAGIAQGNDKVLACADMALKNAKRKHISVGVYNEDNTLLDEYKNNEKWMKVVAKALEEDRIVPYFQPIYSYDKDHVQKYEALMRLIDEDGSVISPANFLDVIKKTSIYPKVTQTMIRKTVDTFRYSTTASFSINITLEDLLNKETMQYFYSVVSAADIFERLIIEIVETEELINFEKVGETLSEFKSRGAKIAIDDFGTGYSNYNYLRKLDVDFIKIDGSIIENISDLKTREIVSTILDFARKSGMQTIAEFVSSKEIDESVKELGVDFAQGYFRGKPSPSIEIL